MKLKTIGALVVALAVGWSVGGCGRKQRDPRFVYMPDMAYSPSYKAQEKGVMIPPVDGTIPREMEFYDYKNDPEAAGRELKNPLPRTVENILHGKEKFEIFCLVCHGPAGKGNGNLKPLLVAPSLNSDKVRSEWSDGRIFHVITMGQGRMNTYASQVEPMDRWAIIHYVRALQRAANPSAEDIERAKK